MGITGFSFSSYTLDLLDFLPLKFNRVTFGKLPLSIMFWTYSSSSLYLKNIEPDWLGAAGILIVPSLLESPLKNSSN
jgi:hypothetical protein